MKKLLMVLLLFPITAIAQTNSQYFPTTGQAVSGMVILQSTDGINALPLNAANPLPVTTSGSASGSVTPTAGTASAIVTGGTAVTLVTGPIKGGYVCNPLTATDQNIATAEAAYVNPVATATSNGRGTNSVLQPGQCITFPAQTTNVSAIAATTAHAFNVVVW